MISAILFDLDGTLVQSEKLKALAYAVAVQQLRDLPEPEERAIEAYREIVGAARDVASQYIVDALDLGVELRPFLGQNGATKEWEVLASMRKTIYEDMVADPQVIRDNQWPHTVGLLRVAREAFCRTALATMSYREEALHVLRALDLDEILTREDVQEPKPNPEIYQKAAQKLGVQPQHCLVLEDSPTGVRAGVAAGMNVIGIATPFTSAGLHASQVLDHSWVVHEPEDLLDVVEKRIAEHNLSSHNLVVSPTGSDIPWW